MTEARALIREAQDKAERLCALARPLHPPVDGEIRLADAREDRRLAGPAHLPSLLEHLRAGKRFDVQTAFVVEPTSGQLLAHATLTSEIYGTVGAHARVFLGGDGVNESNPLETGETSAVGRALGMWGFGCYGTGIASADEVLRVADRPDGSGPVPGRGPGPPEGANGAGSAAASAGSPTEGEEGRADELARLGAALGLRPGEVALRRAQAGSDEEALGALRAELAGHLRSDATTREGLLAHAGRLGVEVAACRAYLVARYQLRDAEAPESALGDEQLREERERLVRRYQEHDTAAGFREQCARVLRSAAA